jgi:uncharacterized membrane protein AbrB (regulator of aidB expression)
MSQGEFMKDRHKRYATKSRAHIEDKKSVFSVVPILFNLIAIAVLIGVYLYITRTGMFPDYEKYIYWTVNVLISYNILVSSARSFLVPIVTTIGSGLILICIYSYNGAYLSVNEDWQLLGLGIVGFFIAYSRLL